MQADVAAEQSPEKEFWQWLLSPNIAMIGRAFFYLAWLWRVKTSVQDSWSFAVILWRKWGVAPFLFGIGDMVVLALGPVVIAYAVVPYAIYLYCRARRLGSVANTGLNVSGWLAAELVSLGASYLLFWLIL